MVYLIFSAIYKALYFLSINERSNCYTVIWIYFKKHYSYNIGRKFIYCCMRTYLVFINPLELEKFHLF